jgi:hypothetical protein
MGINTKILTQVLILLLRTQGAFVPPVAPPQTVFTGLVILEVIPDANGRPEIATLAGPPPFLEASLAAVKNWKLTQPASVTFVYRAREIYSSIPGVEIQEWPAVPDSPPLPRTIYDAEYPANSVGEGVVILQLNISATGKIEKMETVRDVPSLTEPARRSVANWTFSPATRGGAPVPGIAIVGISFLRPVS